MYDTKLVYLPYPDVTITNKPVTRASSQVVSVSNIQDDKILNIETTNVLESGMHASIAHETGSKTYNW